MSIAVLGLSFKPGTDDMRESPSLDLIPSLVENVKEIKVYDPIAMDEASKHIKDVYYANNIEDCIENVDVTIIIQINSQGECNKELVLQEHWQLMQKFY